MCPIVNTAEDDVLLSFAENPNTGWSSLIARYWTSCEPLRWPFLTNSDRRAVLGPDPGTTPWVCSARDDQQEASHQRMRTHHQRAKDG